MAKKKNKKEEERLENPFEVFMRNYRTVPGFKILIKLSLPFILCIIIMVVVAVGTPRNEEVDVPEVTTPEKQKLTYKELLDNIYLNDNKYEVNIIINENNYQIKATYENKVLTGFYEDSLGIKQFKIENDKIYEIKMNQEIENLELLNALNLDYIIPEKLVSYIESLTAVTKTLNDGNTQYNYENNDIQIHVIISEEKVIKIEVLEPTYSYTIEYK